MLEGLRKEAHYQYRCLRLARGFLTSRFIHCNLQVTYRCNFRCQICDFWKTEHNAAEELTLDDIRLIGRKLNRLGTFIVSLAGGEPLMREDLYDIIRILNAANHFPILITNGWFVDEALAKDILRAGLQEISVSVDYADPKKHDEQRGMEGSWERAMRALELLHKHRPDRRNRVHLISVLMDDNLEDVEPLIRLAKEIGVTYMINLYSWNRGAKKTRLPSEKVTQYLLSLKKKYPEFVTLTTYIEHLDQAIAEGGIGNCQAGKLLLNIDDKGAVARCTEPLDEPVGNILTDDIYAIRDRLHQVQRERVCAQCWTSCRGFAESMTMRPRMRQFREFLNSVKRV
ncbi:MAG: radical SAM protein [Candidatus Sumerlaeota bacterium]|nr:radical SAM protein [Candidatus Sumerlaeota bacterium]